MGTLQDCRLRLSDLTGSLCGASNVRPASTWLPFTCCLLGFCVPRGTYRPAPPCLAPLPHTQRCAAGPQAYYSQQYLFVAATAVDSLTIIDVFAPTLAVAGVLQSHTQLKARSPSPLQSHSQLEARRPSPRKVFQRCAGAGAGAAPPPLRCLHHS